jgi:hypothetical protein
MPHLPLPVRVRSALVSAALALSIAVITPVTTLSGADGPPVTPKYLAIDSFAFLLVSADGRQSTGSMQDTDGDVARAAQKQLGGEVWWFRIEKASYAVRDDGVMRRVRVLFAEHQERWTHTLGPCDRKIEALDRRVSKLDRQWQRLEKEKERAAGDDRDQRLEALRAAQQDLQGELRDLHEKLKESHLEREQVLREVEKRDLLFKEQLYGIAVKSVSDGTAHPVRG